MGKLIHALLRSTPDLEIVVEETVTDRLNTWIETHGSCRDALGAALARLELALSTLEEIEWVDPTGYYPQGEECPWCDCLKKDGHSPDCSRQLALTPPSQTPHTS